MGIPSKIPFSDPGDLYELVLERHKHRDPARQKKSQCDPGPGRDTGKIPSLLAASARTAGVKRTTKEKSHKERSLGFLAKTDTEEQPQFWHPGMVKIDISSIPILCR